MTHAQIATMISSVGVPYAYYQFPNDSGQEPPFICFYYSNNNDFVADNTNFQKIERLIIELYTDNKDFALEETLEGVLASAGLVYSREETYIDTERMFEVTYTTEVLIDG